MKPQVLSFVLRAQFPRRATVAAAMLPILTACGGGSGSSPPPQVVAPPPPVNVAPEFSGDSDFTLEEGETITVDIVVTDPDGDTLTLSLDGPDASAIVFDAQASSATVGPFDFEAPQDADGNNVYSFSIAADDGTDTTTQDFTLTVENISDTPPAFAGQFDLSVDENQPVSVPFSVTDADGDDVALTLGGADAARFVLDETTLTISAGQGFDFELPADADGDNVYEFEVTASDDADAFTQNFTLTVQNVIDLFQGSVLSDPNPAAGHRFGLQLSELVNGNLVVGASTDSTVATEAGAVHIYDPAGVLINSFRGSEAEQEVGSRLLPLQNGNLVANAGAFGRFGGVQSASSVSLLSGDTAAEIQTLGGDDSSDRFGNGGIIELEGSNAGNFVILSNSDDSDNFVNAGSIVLVNGVSGETITRIEGDDPGDSFGREAAALSNGNFIVVNFFDMVNGLDNAGSVILVDGASGDEIARVEGEAVNEFVGSRFAVLPSGDVVVGIRSRDGAVADEGLVLLINGVTGAVIAEIRGGDVGATSLGNTLTALDNGNFVVGASNSDSAGLIDNGFIGLFDGTGSLLASIVGDDDDDSFGQNIVALENGRFLAGNPGDDVEGLVDAGSVSFFDSSGVEVARLAGEADGEMLGTDENIFALPLANGNVVIESFFATGNGVPFAGRLVLVDGATFTEIASVEYDNEFDLDQAEVTTLANGNFVVVSIGDDVNGIEDAGSLRLVDGATGEIVLEVVGDAAFGIDFVLIESLASDHFVFTNANEDVAGVSNAGVVRVLDAATGETVETFQGDQENDRLGSSLFALDSGGFLLGSPGDDLNGLVDSGSVMLVTAQ